jgi:transposase-like protein
LSSFFGIDTVVNVVNVIDTVKTPEDSGTIHRLDEVLNTWRERPLGKIEYLVVDARYEQVLPIANKNPH